MKRKIAKKISSARNGKIEKFLFLLLFLSLCFQNITVLDFGFFSLKLFHIVTVILMPLTLRKKHIKIPPKPITAYIFISVIISIFAYSMYGFNSLLFNYIYGFFLLILVINQSDFLDKKEWLSICRKGAVIIMLVTIIRFIINAKIIIKFLLTESVNSHVGDIIGTIFGGGSNLEATWIALFGLFFYGSKVGLIYSIFSLFSSIIYSSRTGIILSIILVILLLFQQLKEKGIKIHKIIAAATVVTIFIITMMNIGLLDNMSSRFLAFNTSSDNGMSGRNSMWTYIPEAISSNPFGYGLGNAVRGIKIVGSISFIEDNVHNIYFQNILDLGVIGGTLFMAIVIYFMSNELRNMYKNPFAAFIIVYLIGGLVQFRGGEAILFFMIGVYLCTKNEFVLRPHTITKGEGNE